jgi:D-arabinan exo beta-(1,2)-arabinofuranosidase (non-reducing end)
MRLHVRSAVAAVFRHNFRPDRSRHESVQRAYALGDEGGLVTASWPHGGRPHVPFIYSDEVWTGIEYHVAAQLIFEGRCASEF